MEGLKPRSQTNWPRLRPKPSESGKPERFFKELRYQTLKSWSRERRVVAKAEHLPKGANPRFVVTSLTCEAVEAKELYEKIYCARGEMENRIKECQLDLFADRTSAASLGANQLRLWFASLAYVLMTALRRMALQGTELANATAGTIRLKLLKLGALVAVSVRRVKLGELHCPERSYSAVRPRLTGTSRTFKEEAANSAERMCSHGAGRATAAQAHLHAVAFNGDQFDIAAVSEHGGTHLGDRVLDDAQPLFGGHGPLILREIQV